MFDDVATKYTQNIAIKKQHCSLSSWKVQHLQIHFRKLKKYLIWSWLENKNAISTINPSIIVYNKIYKTK